MARKQTLKVYRTPIGFHDAYVAAPSQKAALVAWGSDADLFARGDAEVVTDEDLAREPLENPGKVIKRSRGSAAEQLAALPANEAKSRKTRSTTEAAQTTRTRRKTAAKRSPRPSRAALKEAEQKLDRLLDRQKHEDEDLSTREKAIDRERRDLDRAHERARREAERSVGVAREDHAAALGRWIEQQG
jgi:hypothetical protein